MPKVIQAFQEKMNVNRDLLLLLLIGGLYSLGIFLSNTFVNIYLWRQSGDYITIAVYNLGINLFQALTFIVAGRLAKKVDRIIVLRLGVIFLSLFFLSVLMIGENASTFNFLLGCLLGIGYGFYWMAFNVLTFEITEPDTRDFFNGFLGILQSLGGMIGPLLAGIIISRLDGNVGYTTIFTISFILFIFAVAASFFLQRRSAKGNYYFRRIIRERNNNKNWKRILYAHFFQGIREGVFFFIISIWVFIVTQSEFALGKFNLFLSGLSAVLYFIVTKYLKPSSRKKAILVGASLLYLSIYIIIFNANYFLLMVYAIVIGIAYPIINVPYVSLTYDVIGKAWKAGELRIEYIVVRELFLNTGRIVSVLIFLLSIAIFDAERVIPIILVIFGAGHLVIYFFIKRIQIGSTPQKEILMKEQITDEKDR